MSIWTAQADEKMLDYKSRGYSCSQIALRLGHEFTRNAVIGRLSRIQKRIGKLPTNKRISVRQEPAKKSVYQLPPYGAKPPQTAPSYQSRIELYRSVKGISLLRAEQDQCRWPLEGNGDDCMPRCCGLPKVRGCPYCVEHARAAFTHDGLEKLGVA